MSDQTPKSPGLSTARALLDDALVRLRDIADPGVARRETEVALAGALQSIYQAMGATRDYEIWQTETANALEGARQALASLQQHPTDDPGAAEDMALVAQALAALREARPSVTEPRPSLPVAGETKRILRATVGIPTLLDFNRAILYPAVVLPELSEPLVLPEPDMTPAPEIGTEEEFEELLARNAERFAAFMQEQDAEPAEGELEAEVAPPEPSPPPEPLPPLPDEVTEREIFGERLEKADVIWEWVKTAFEDLAAFGLMRIPIEGEGVSWTSRERTEARLLARVDAIVAGGDVHFPRLVKLIEERPVIDPDLFWAALFFFGSLSGDDALDEVVRLTKCAPLQDGDTLERVADALALAPHPGIDVAVTDWLRSPDWPRRVLAVDVLERRGTLSRDGVMAAAEDPERRVVASAARALGYIPGGVPPDVFARLLARPESDIVQAAIESSILQLCPEGSRIAEQLVCSGRPDFGRAVVFVALWSGHDALPMLRDAAATDASAPVLRAIGWFGSTELVPFLIGRLTPDDEAVCGAALEALFRITGAWLTDDAPDPVYDEDDLPFKRGFAPPPQPLDLTIDPEIWKRWWDVHGPRARRERRYRWGHEWSFRDNLWEIEQELSSRRNRWLAHLEMTARSGGSVRFRTNDFVQIQRARVEEWKSFLDEGRIHRSLGQWPSRQSR